MCGGDYFVDDDAHMLGMTMTLAQPTDVCTLLLLSCAYHPPWLLVPYILGSHTKVVWISPCQALLSQSPRHVSGISLDIGL